MHRTDVPESKPKSARVSSIARVAVGGSACGLITLIPVLPSGLLALLLGVFVLAGLGSAIVGWFPAIPTPATVGLVPVAGLAVVILVVTGLLAAGIYEPTMTLAVLAIAALGSGLCLLRAPDGETEVR